LLRTLWRGFNLFVFIVAFGTSQKALLMKPQNIVIALVIVAAGAGLSTLAEWPAVAERQVAPAEIDFTVLHRQASNALDNLRRSQRHLVSTSAAAF